MGGTKDDDLGSAQTGSPDTLNALASTRASIDRTPSQEKLRDVVKGALFDGKALPEVQTLEVGAVLAGRYRLIALLGAGGMGEVYRAYDLVLGEEVALKFLPSRYAQDPALMARFVNEVRIARQITHPNACRVHDMTEADGRSILSMEYIDGEDLASLLRRIGRLPEEKAMELAQQLCSGLAALHEQGMLHRDLKPSNVMVDGRGRLKICDFGLAAAEGELTAREFGDGTPAYMAPEQARGEGVSAQSDIYSLGLVLFELISGKHALTGDASHSTVASRLRTGPAALSSHVRGVAPEVEAVLKQCLESDPDERPRSVLEVAAALPGGDPLAAAAAAGRAPSVDMVAGARGRGALSTSVGWSLAVAAAVMVCLFGFLGSQYSRLSLGAATDLPPDVLEHRAKQLLAEVGAPEGVDSFRRYRRNQLEIESEAQRSDSAGFSASQMLFEYRQSPEPMLSLSEPVSMTEPGYDEPGGARMTLTSSGQLRQLRVVPPVFVDATGADYDWSGLFEAAGLQLSMMQPADPETRPDDFSDRRWAWTGRTGERDIRVEASSVDGKPTAFDVLFGWDLAARREDAAGQETNNGQLYAAYGAAVLVFAVGISLLFVARRLWRRGEADPRSALRVALGLTAMMAVGQVMSGHAVGVAGLLALVLVTLRTVVTVALAAFLVYIVVEPYGRRYIPRAMTSWARLMRGNVRDPLVGRDVLIGVTIGGAIAVVEFTKSAIYHHGVVDTPATWGSLMGARFALSSVVDALWIAPLGVLQTYGFYIVARLALRGPKRAAAAVVLLWTVFEFPFPFHGGWAEGLVLGLISVLIAVALLLLVVRVGLLATVAMQLTLSLVFNFPVTTDLSVWFAASGFPAVVVIAALVAYGVRFGVRHEP